LLRMKIKNFLNRLILNKVSLIVVFTGLVLSMMAFKEVLKWEHQKIQAGFERAAEKCFWVLEREIDSALDVLLALKAFYATSQNINRSQFRDFVSSLLSRHAGIQALGWIPLIEDSQKERYETAAKRDGSPDFQITEKESQGKMVRASKRKEYFPVYFVEPYKGNEITLGFDLAADRTRLEALELARNKGEMVATGRVKLLEETGNQFGLLVFIPVYQKGASVGSIQARRINLEGFILGVFRIGDIFKESLDYLKPAGVNVYLYDKSAPEEERFLCFYEYFYETGGKTTPSSVSFGGTVENRPEKPREYVKTLHFANRKWELRVIPTPDYFAVRRTWQPVGVLLGGLLLTGLLAAYLRVSLNRAQWIGQLVIDRTRDLQKSNEILVREIVVRMQSEEALEKAHDALDSRVRERTGELSESNEQLRKEIHERRQMEEALRRSEETAMRLARENALMAEMGCIIGSSLNIEEVYDRFVKEVRKLISFDRISINIIDYEKECFTVPYVIGPEVAGRKRGQTIPLSGTATEEVVRTRSSLLIQKKDEKEIVGRLPGLQPVFKSGLQSLMLIPLIYKDKVIGGLNVQSTQPGIYTERDLKVAERVAQQIAGAISNAQLFNERKRGERALRKSEEEARRLADEKAVMAEIGRIINSTFDIETVFERFSKEVRRIVPFDRIAINIIDYQKNTFTILYTSGLNMPERKKGTTLSLAGAATEEVIRTKRPLQIQEDKQTHRRFSSLLPVFLAGFRSFLFIPMISQDKVIGVLSFLSTQPEAYTEKELRVAEEVGNQIAGAIANAQLFAACRQAEETVRKEKEKAQKYLDVAGAIIAVIESNQRVSLINQMGCEVLGYEEGEIIGANWMDTFLPEWDRDRMKAVFARLMAGEVGPVEYFENPILTKNGEEKLIAWYNTLLRDQAGTILGVLSSGEDISERKRAETEIRNLLQSVEQKREELRALTIRLQEVEEAERRRLAQELHDRVGQNFAALSINLNIIQRELPAEFSGKVGARLEDSLQLLEETALHIRDVMAELRPPVLDDYGLLAALQWYGEQFTKRTGVPSVIQGAEATPRLPLPLEAALFRVTQEALTNVARHAQARQVTVTLEELAQEVRLTIADDGTGFDFSFQSETGSAWGLISMRERAEAIGGRFQVKSAPGEGTRIMVAVRK